MADVKINIILEDLALAGLENLSDTMDGLRGTADGVGRAFEMFGSIMTGIESVINLAQKAFDALVVPVIEYGKESLLAAARVDQLRAVNEMLGETAGIPALFLEQTAAAIRKTGIEAEVAENTIAAFIILPT